MSENKNNRPAQPPLVLVIGEHAGIDDMAKSAPLLPRYATPTGLNLPEGLDLEIWLTLGAELACAETALTWAIGDWWGYGEHHYGERLEIVNDPNWSGPSYQACKDYGSVARHFERSRRHDLLSLSHHREVMGLSEADQDALLTWVEEPLRSGEPRPRSTWVLRERVRQLREQQYRDVTGVVINRIIEHADQPPITGEDDEAEFDDDDWVDDATDKDDEPVETEAERQRRQQQEQERAVEREAKTDEICDLLEQSLGPDKLERLLDLVQRDWNGLWSLVLFRLWDRVSQRSRIDDSDQTGETEAKPSS